jgi:RpiR family transcriptional regulator, carbohydrate utilization regulator
MEKPRRVRKNSSSSHGREEPTAPGPAGTRAAPPEPPTGALARIQQCQGTLAGSTSRAAEYVLANPWEARGLSIGDLAQRIGVSINTVNRMARELGYRGYREFAQALALDLGKVLGSAYSLPASLTASGAPETAFAVVSRTLALEMHSIHETLQVLDAATVERAVEDLASANAVLMIGTGSSLAICALAAYRLAVLGVRATSSADVSAIIAEIHLLRPGDVVFAISHHGAHRPLVHALRHARARGLSTISLTAAPGSPIAHAAEVTLTTIGQGAGVIAGQFASRVVGAAVVEGLIAAVAWRKYGGTPARVEEVLRAQREANAAPFSEPEPPAARRERRARRVAGG